MRMSWTRKAFGGVLALVLLAACSSGGSSKTSSSSGGKQKIVVTTGGACICHAPLYVGIAKGFFSQRGMDIQFRKLTSGFTAMGALQTGDADVADAVVAVAAQGASQGIDATAALIANGDPSGTFDTSNYFAVVARPGSGITADQVQSLRGKKIAVAVGTVAHQYLYYTLKKAGLDATKDVTIQNVQPADLVSALQSHSVDAIVGWEPGPLTALAKVKGSYLVIRGGGAMQYTFARWFAPKFLQAHPAAAANFVAAFVESMQYTRQHPEESASIVAKQLNGVDKQTIVQAMKYLNFDPRISIRTLDSAQQGLDFTAAIGTRKGNYSFTDHLDSKLIDQVLAANPQYLSDLPAIPAALKVSTSK
jgi:ABC-type nitrate/sulfonate/bicarbonate transport system substrate-binding protein